MFRLAKTFLLHHLTFAGKWHICFCLNSTVCRWRADTNQTKNKSSSPFYPSPPVYSVVAASLLRWYFVLRSKCSFTDFHISSDYLQYFWNQPQWKNCIFSSIYFFNWAQQPAMVEEQRIWIGPNRGEKHLFEQTNSNSKECLPKDQESANQKIPNAFFCFKDFFSHR